VEAIAATLVLPNSDRRVAGNQTEADGVGENYAQNFQEIVGRLGVLDFVPMISSTCSLRSPLIGLVPC
jgi:hypothetical protein